MDYLKKITKKIFQYEASLVLKRYKPKIIAITGSVGKTLTREAVYLVLSKNFFVRKNEKSFTAELGVPFTIIGCPSGKITPVRIITNILLGLKLLIWKSHYPDWLVLEIDGDKPGDLSLVSSFLSIDILIVTELGEVPAHVESFYEIYNFLLEKKYLLNAVKREGVIIYNGDDMQVENVLRETVSRKISYGTSGDCNVYGSDFEILYTSDKKDSIPVGMSFEIAKEPYKGQVSIIGTVGIHNEYACLSAFAVGVELGITEKEICVSLNKYKNMQGRMNLVSGIMNSVIIDDSYNASPVAMSMAISVLGRLKCVGKKIAVLGDMLELGKYSAEEHRKLAGLLKGTASNVICVGLRMRRVSEELLGLGFDESKIILADTSEEAGMELQKIIEEGDTVLIKGSQSMRMEKVVEEIMRHPEDREKLLVRQEPEWLSRMN